MVNVEITIALREHHVPVWPVLGPPVPVKLRVRTTSEPDRPETRGPGVARERHRAVRHTPRPLQPRVAVLERLVKTADPQERVLAGRDIDGHGAAALQHDRGLLAAGVVVLPAANSVYGVRRRRPAVCQCPVGSGCRWRPMDRGSRASARGAKERDGSSSSSSIHCVPGLAFVRMGTPHLDRQPPKMSRHRLARCGLAGRGIRWQSSLHGSRRISGCVKVRLSI